MTDPKRCSVCKQPGLRKLIDGYLEEGMTGVGISRALADIGVTVTDTVVLNHRTHWQAEPERPAGTRKKDFAILVRDKAVEQLEEGKLDLTDKDQVAGINAGLKAQQIIDKREARKPEQNFWIALGDALAAKLGVGETPLLADPNVTEGEFEEVESD